MGIELSEAELQRRLKPVKSLSVLILAPRKHDRQLWAELLKNCGINHPLSMADVERAAPMVGSGQVDVVFVDEAYGPRGIANVLIPARNVEFAGGRGVCLILCSKKATTQDVLNARKLGFASLVILPASTDTVRKHLELASRYIPPSDEELGWSLPAPKSSPNATAKTAPAEASAPSHGGDQLAKSQADMTQTAKAKAPAAPPAPSGSNKAQAPVADQAAAQAAPRASANPASKAPAAPTSAAAQPARGGMSPNAHKQAHEATPTRLKAPGRSGPSADEEVVFL